MATSYMYNTSRIVQGKAKTQVKTGGPRFNDEQLSQQFPLDLKEHFCTVEGLGLGHTFGVIYLSVAILVTCTLTCEL